MTARLKVPKGSIRHGSVYSGPAAYQDDEYRRRVEAIMAARQAKQKKEREAAA